MAKKSYIISVFDRIAPSYDKLNHVLSLNIDKIWRKKAVKRIASKHPQHVLDVACGTGDFSIALAQAGIHRIEGIDISEGMMEVGRQKVERLGLADRITTHQDDCESLSLASDSVDAVTVAFGVRNFEHLPVGLKEMNRVLRPGGEICVLELSVPLNPVLLWCYKLYFLHILPWIGGLVSGQKDAYRYLPMSVLNFPKPDRFCQMLTEAGFSQVEAHSYTFGLCRMFIGTK